MMMGCDEQNFILLFIVIDLVIVGIIRRMAVIFLCLCLCCINNEVEVEKVQSAG